MRLHKFHGPGGYRIILDNGLDGIPLSTSHYEAVALMKAREQLEKITQDLQELQIEFEDNHKKVAS